MITLRRSEYVDKLNAYGLQYGRQILNALANSSYIDTNFANQVIEAIGTFAPVIRQQSIVDVNMFHVDSNRAMQMIEDYESFGDYCYEQLQDAFYASNECLNMNAKLADDLQKRFDTEYCELAVSSGYIAWNMLGGTVSLHLNQFRRMTGVGLVYDLQYKTTNISMSSMYHDEQHKLDKVIEIANIIDGLKNDQSVHNLLDNWSAEVNDKLYVRKELACLAWHSTYDCFKNDWVSLQFIKQVKQTVCQMDIIDGMFIETVMKAKQRTKRINWQQDDLTIVLFDYVNVNNFTFEQ